VNTTAAPDQGEDAGGEPQKVHQSGTLFLNQDAPCPLQSNMQSHMSVMDLRRREIEASLALASRPLRGEDARFSRGLLLEMKAYRCLQAAARLPDETWANVLLISSRVPEATLVKSYEAWRSVGRQVIQGEKGVEIFSSARQQAVNRRDPDDHERDLSWRDANRVIFVWDLSQTGGQPLPSPLRFPHRPGRYCRGYGTACAGLPGGKALRSSASMAARPTAPRSGPLAASAFFPAPRTTRPSGR
jgi:N-terminal domain of anti-restriction factor ArdC